MLALILIIYTCLLCGSLETMSDDNRLLAAGLEVIWNCTTAAVTCVSTSPLYGSTTASGCITRGDGNDEQQSFPPPTVEVSRDLPAWMMATVPLYGVMCAVGLTGNALVVGVVMRSAAMRSSVTNNYIVNLAVSDFCFLSGLPLLMVTVVKQVKTAFFLETMHWRELSGISIIERGLFSPKMSLRT